MKKLQRIEGYEITSVGLNNTVKKLAKVYARPRKETKQLLLSGFMLSCGVASYRVKSNRTRLERELDLIEAKDLLQ